ncbi:tetratricopeptide repeat protein [Streptomyces sp. NPDC060027]|uniref:tetratricopeptide repeat protein n=1 Tax=Streptomyces sp. NPDC060027 TaxID=3347040 RepID=UPI00369947DE
MFNHRGESERSLTAPLPGPRFIAWWVWSAVSLSGLLAALWWAGEDHPAWQREGFFGIVGAIGRIFGGIGSIFRVGDQNGASLGARLAFLLALLLLLYMWWRATRAWLAYKPGPVDVQQLEDATQAGTVKPSNADLTAKLRRRLSESSMYPPTTLPAQAPVETFLELIGDVELDPNNLGKALPRVLSRLRPKLAYRVSGVLQSRVAEPDRYGMTITVTAFLFGGSRAMTIWGTDWDEVISKASIWVVSSLLPVTRAGRRAPWRYWWGRELKPELYQAYQEGTELSRAGRHHEALERYFQAVQLDPRNAYLRAELVEIQEKMGLHVDALNTAQRALTLDGQTARSYRNRLWRNRWIPHWSRLRYLRHPRRYSEVLGLRYRNSIILGTSETTAKQWYTRTGTHGTETHKELIPILVERYWPTVIDMCDAGTRKERMKQAKESLREILEKQAGDEKDGAPAIKAERTVALVFQRASIQETNRLASDDRWARVLLYWPTALWSWTRFIWPAAYLQSFRGAQQPVTRGAFLTNRRVCAPLRLAWASWEYDQNASPYKWRRRYAWRWRSRISWTNLRIRSLRRRLFFARRWPLLYGDWHSRYNAACVYAIAMHSTDDKQEKEEFAKQAICQLEAAVLIPRMTFATVEREWMTGEDPDLKELWASEIFGDFIRTAYPSVESPSVHSARDLDSTDAMMREYDYRLLEAVAKVMEQAWRARSEKAGSDIDTTVSWLGAECEIWNSLREIVDDKRKYMWQDRVDLIHCIQANCHSASSDTPGFPPQMGANESHSTAGHSSLSSQKINKLFRDLNCYMGSSENTCDTPYSNGTPYSYSEEGQRVLRDAAADGLTWLNAKTVRKLSIRYAAAWHRLGDWLEFPESKSQEPFSQAVGNVPQLTRRTLSKVEGGKIPI